MQYKIITDVKEFKLLEEEWNLLFDSRIYSVFQSFLFNYYSWKDVLCHFSKNKLFIIKITEDNITIGLFPLYIDQKNKLRFINDINADFCDIILSKKIDFDNLFQFILNDCKQKRIQLINLKEDSMLTHFGSNHFQSNINFSAFESYTELKVDKGIFPYNCNKLNKKRRNEIKRILSKNSIYKHEILVKDHSIFPINEILTLKEKMIKNGSRDKNFLPTNQLKLIERLYDSNQIEISLVKDGEVIAILFIVKNNNNFLLWIDLYDDIQVISFYNYISFIAVTSLNKDICINFGRGAYKWKVSKFRPDIQELYRLNFYSNGLYCTIHIITSYILAAVKLMYRKFK